MSGIDNQVEYWDSVAKERTFSHPLNASLFKSLVHFNDHILDYGCGYGRTCNELFSLGFQNVVGIDSSPQMIERGRNTHISFYSC
jgi:SAM-dependent methyltransferase